MKRHVILAVFVLALAACSQAETSYSASQDSQDRAAVTQSDAKLSKKDRKRLEKEEKKAGDRDRKKEKDLDKKEAKEQRKQYKKQEKQLAKERKREKREQEKQVASNREKDEKYERKEAERTEKEEARDMNRHMEREARIERANTPAPAPRYAYVPRIPISTTATPGLLLAQRQVSRAIYSQLPLSDVRVLLNGGNQILLRGSAPTPSLRQRLLQLAVGAAQGYSVVDQLAANLVGNAASAATSAAIGGVTDLIHGHGSSSKDTGSEGLPEPGSDSAQQAAAYPQQALPNNDSDAMATVLDPGSNACVNVSNSSQALLTGQVASQPSADLIRRFAHQLAGPSALVTDQLAVRTTGVTSDGYPPPNTASTSSADTASANFPATAVSPSSTVCVTQNGGQLLLTGTVGSTADLGTVENAVKPLIGSGRLLDQLTIAGMNSANQTAASAPVGNVTPTPLQQSEVEQALHSIPRLANVNVQVASDGLHLSGSVDSAQDDQMAADVARQYVAGRLVVDNLEVANRAQPTQPQQ